MPSIFRLILSALLGLSLAVYGLAHSVSSYPSPTVFSRLADALPTLGTVAFFALGVLATLAGLVLAALAVRQIRRHVDRHRKQAEALQRAGRHDVPALRRVPAGRDPDGGYDGIGYDDSGYYGPREAASAANGEADRREWPGEYR